MKDSIHKQFWFIPIDKPTVEDPVCYVPVSTPSWQHKVGFISFKTQCQLLMIINGIKTNNLT